MKRKLKKYKLPKINIEDILSGLIPLTASVLMGVTFAIMLIIGGW